MASTKTTANGSSDALWRPTQPTTTRTHAFRQSVNEKFSLSLESYEDLWEWSIGSPADFWDLVWDETEVVGEKGSGPVVDKNAAMSSIPTWFPSAKINWAENMLKCRSPTKIALVQATEPTLAVPNPTLRQVTYAELYTLVSQTVDALRAIGITPGDRVASYSTNCIENVVASLASIALGAIWVSAAADFGPDGVLERLEQIKPRVLFSVEATIYNAKLHDHVPKLTAVLNGLASSSLAPEKVIVIPSPHHDLDAALLRNGWKNDWVSWADFVGPSESTGVVPMDIDFWRGSFDHPLWILFSSGTTGKPKPIVHRAGGMLLQSLKELAICGDFAASDVFFYYTTTGWMMWNFLVSALPSGCTLVLYDGSPLKDPKFLWDLTDRLGITIFGTSAKYLEQLAKVYRPKEHHKLTSLRMVLSTGSPLAPNQFDYVYEHISSDVLLGSITGGTDICSLFAGMNTSLPVYRGQIQCKMLGMSIRAYSDDGKPLPAGVPGDLVCDVHFPCQPLGFWPLPSFGESVGAVRAAKTRYLESYYEKFEGVWYHGDHVLVTNSVEGNGGGVIMLGRSDGVLNPGGVRFGSSEIYEVLELYFSSNSSETIVDSLVVGQMIQDGTDERVILFLKLAPGEVLGEHLVKRVKDEIRKRRTPRHVPAKVIQVVDIPHTLNGKKVEVPVKKLISGASVSSLNASTLRNPECLAEYVVIGENLRADLQHARL